MSQGKYKIHVTGIFKDPGIVKVYFLLHFIIT